MIRNLRQRIQSSKAGSWRLVMSVVWVGLTGVTIAVLGLVTWQSRETLLVALRTARYGRLAWTFVAYTASIGAIAVGWHLVMRHLGGERRFAVNAKIYVSTLAARRLPGTLWYIAGRAVLYRRLGTPVRLCSIASGIEVILSIVSGLMVGAPALLSRAEASPFQVAIGVVIELAGLCLLHPKVLRWLLARSGHFVEPGELTVLRVGSWIVAYVAMWISGGLMAYSVVSALYPVSLSAMPLTVSLWSLTGVISYLAFLLPSNLGLSEITLSLLLSRIFPLPITVTAAILIRVLTTAVDIVWSSLLLYEMKRHPDLFQPG